MLNTCSVVYCKTGYKKRENKEDKIPEKHPVFGFPDSKPDLKAKWVKFVSRMSWLPTKNFGICAKQFEETFLKKGLCATLRWDLNPVPTLHCNIESTPKSLLPSQTTGRVAPKDRSTLEDEHSKFCKIDRISNFEDLNESLCPTGYQLKKEQNEAISYKIEPHSVLSVPQVSETNVADKMLHVKLFSVASPIPLPEWFRKGSECCLRKKSMLENFPSYIRNVVEVIGY